MKLEIDVTPIFEDRLVVDTVTLLEHLALAWQEDTDEIAMISALETALCLARDLEGNAGENGPHKSPHTQHQLERDPRAALFEMRLGRPNPQRSAQA
jgi:hypothetical protein